MLMMLALLLATILTFLGALHIYWVLGGRWGSAAVIPTLSHEASNQNKTETALFKPPPVATLTVAAALLIAALLVLLRADLIDVPLLEGVARVAVWFLAFVFLLRSIGDFRYLGFFKRVHDTRFAQMDSRYYSPLCLVLALLASLISLQAR